MNLLNKLTIKNLKLNKKRTIVTIIGIMLSVALITAVSGMFFSVKESFINYEKRNHGNYHYLFQDVNEKDFNQFELNKKIETVNFVYNLGYSILDGITNEYKPYVYVKGYTRSSFENVGVVLIEGNLPKNENEIIIPSHLKYNGGVEYEIGDTITLNIGKRLIDGSECNQFNPFQPDMETIENTITKTFKVVGIMQRPDTKIEPYTAPGYTMITFVDEKNSSNEADVYVRYTKAGLKDYHRTTGSILGVNPEYYYEIYNYDAHKIDNYEQKLKEVYDNKKFTEQQNPRLISLENNFLADDTMVGLGLAASVVVVVIIFTSVFCIKNSFDISITEKTRQYGMLSSIGATRKQIKQNVYYEALILGIIGIPLGILLGLIATFILVIISDYFLESAFNEGFNLTFTISFLAILFSIILGLITIILSARKSAKRASKISPINAIRNSEDIKIKNNRIKTPILIKSIFGIGGLISYKNLKRSKKKYRTTVISIVVSIIVYLAVTGFINVAFSFLEFELPTDDYNITINYRETTDKNANIYETIQSIEKLSNVEKYSYTSYTDYCISNPKFSNEYLEVYPKISEQLSEEGMCLELVVVSKNEFRRYTKSLGINTNENKQNGILVNTIYHSTIDKNNKKTVREIDMFGYNKGDIIKGNIKLYDSYIDSTTVPNMIEYNIKIAGNTTKVPMGYSSPIYHPIIVVSEENEDLVINENRQKDIFIYSSNADKTFDELKELFTDYEVHIFNMEEEARTQKSLYILIAIFLYGFITVIALIGTTNIFNTITTNMSLRQREFATLKSIGMTNDEFNRMIRLETLFYCGKSLLIGLPIGILFTYIIYRLFNQGELVVKYVFPWSAIIIVCLILFILIFTIMKYSLDKIKKQNTIETIRNENI